MADISSIRIPKTFGALADRIFTLQEKRREIQRKVKAIDEEEKALKAYFLENLPKGDGGAVGKKCRITVLNDVSYSIENDAEFYEYVKKTGSFDLLQRSVVKAAYVARLDNNETVPGVQSFTFKKLSINRL